tara:strand:- start:125 stop:394 length:270 start_codon:yes stop_codon:yes gene_type:complete
MIILRRKINPVATDPQNASDPRSANHHWFPFLRYQEECASQGKEATVDGWLRSQGKLKHQIAYEKAKAEAQSNIAKEVKPAASSKPDSE